MPALKGQAALVTGCARMQGIGRQIALTLARAGADVAVCDIDAAGTRNLAEKDQAESVAGWRGLESVAEEIRAAGARSVSLLGDVGMKSDAERLVSSAVQEFGRIDILVNNAGAPHGADRNWMWEVPEDAFDSVMRVNTKSVYLMSGAVIRHLLQRAQGGRIINIASGAGKQGFAQRAAYCASKFAVIGLTQSMAMELAPHGITVNAVCPGPIATARGASRVGQAITPFKTPVARAGIPEDIARTVAFLAEAGASYITGQSINVDGGLIMH